MTTNLDLTPDGVSKALNQLASVLGGRDLAVATNDLSSDPFARIQAIASAATQDLVEAAASGDSKALSQAQRKTQSLVSLATLAEVIRQGMDWDAIR